MKTEASRSEAARVVPVNWSDFAWRPRVMRRAAVRGTPPGWILGPRRRNLIFTQNKTMKLSSVRLYRRPTAFTLIELLVVIAIIGILAGLILSALGAAKTAAYKGRARTEMSTLQSAINAYETTYTRMPCSSPAAADLTAVCPDFTFGTMQTGGYGTMTFLKNTFKPKLVNGVMGALPKIVNLGIVNGYQANNSEVMAILMDQVNVPDPVNYPPQTVNANHAKNPQQHPFFEGHYSGDGGSPGIGQDLVYRDPWGNPYIITLDMNGDNKCRDGFYDLETVSDAGGGVGLNGLVMAPGFANSWEAPVTVMIWSFGPDGQADPNAKANAGFNKDNLLSWH